MNNDDLIDQILGLDNLNPEQEKARQALNQAADVDFTTRTAGWEIILKVLEDIRIEAEDKALGVLPGNNEQIIASHAVAFAVRESHRVLLETIQEIRAGKTEALEYLSQQEYE